MGLFINIFNLMSDIRFEERLFNGGPRPLLLIFQLLLIWLSLDYWLGSFNGRLALLQRE
jgi:hypothetical protein